MEVMHVVKINPIPLDPALLKMEGISEKQIREHFEVLYRGYVNKFNEIQQKLVTANRADANATYSEFRGLKVGETFSMDGVKLHEMYFQNLGGKGGQPKGPLLQAIVDNFGSYKKWQDDFIATGIAARGWAILSFDPRDHSLHNYLLDAHDHGVVIRSVPLLILDVYEHAYFIDYGTKRRQYIEAFFKNINWAEVEKRFLPISKAFDYEQQ
jgi:Fe-Mn family superoxide dismutase